MSGETSATGSSLLPLLLTFTCIYLAKSEEEVILSSPPITDLGEWGFWDNCSENTYVKGMRLKTEPFQGPLDDTGLNGIQLLCGRLGEDSRVVQSRKIQSSIGKWGSIGGFYECPWGYAVGFQLRSESFQGNGGDNMAANNLRIYCNGTNGSKGYLEGGGLPWGKWTELQLCPWKHALCGLRTQVQSPQGHNVDDTSLNNVAMKCCEVN